MPVTATLIITVSYLLGAIPFGLLVGKIAGIDVRASGSGNIGATNVSRLLGKRLGVLTLCCDAAKALVPMALAGRIFSGQPVQAPVVALCGAAAFLGHCYPVYLRFKGGKGVATALGIFLYLSPLAAAGAVAVFILLVAVRGYVSLGSLAAAAITPPLVWLLTQSLAETLLAVFIAVLIWIKHRENIVRLLRGEEKSWKKGKA